MSLGEDAKLEWNKQNLTHVSVRRLAASQQSAVYSGLLNCAAGSFSRRFRSGRGKTALSGCKKAPDPDMTPDQGPTVTNST